MPGKQRFGSLLGTVEPLPDPDDEVAPPNEPPPAAAPEPVAPAPREETPPPAPVTVPDSPKGRRDHPPATLRVNEQAGTALWAAYLEAKADDPFLSYRQFTSGVVLDGLNHGARRALRRR